MFGDPKVPHGTTSCAHSPCSKVGFPTTRTQQSIFLSPKPLPASDAKPTCLGERERTPACGSQQGLGWRRGAGAPQSPPDTVTWDTLGGGAQGGRGTFSSARCQKEAGCPVRPELRSRDRIREQPEESERGPQRAEKTGPVAQPPAAGFGASPLRAGQDADWPAWGLHVLSFDVL